MTTEYDFIGPNVGYVLELYEKYQRAPESFDPATRAFFANWTPPTNGTSPALLGTATENADMSKILGTVNFAQAIRLYGHLAAQLDPLGNPTPGDPELIPQAHGITYDMLRDLPASLVSGSIGQTAHNALEAIEALQEVYSASIGFDFDHIRIAEERQWLREAAESRRYRLYSDTQDKAKKLLERLTQVETFENFLQKNFPTKYRFSIEGLDMMVPLLDEVIELAANTGVRTIAIGTAHRGRLNILAHIMNKTYEQILSEFKDPVHVLEQQHAIGWTTGDVKYHKGVRYQLGGSHPSGLTLTMPPNPSHLEAINPVAVGMARAAGTNVDKPGAPIFDPALTMQILIHGDASFPGQGIVAETFNLSQLPGYWTGGTIHIIANNQIGFTTLPRDGRSTLYASDLAKGFKVPIVHVNADDPEACIEVARMAFAYQEKFEKDFLIDLVGYRRYGHNELDEPGFTQPLMYQTIRNHPTVRQLWADKLVKRSIIASKKPDELVANYSTILQKAYDANPPVEELIGILPVEPPVGAAKQTVTAVSIERLQAVNQSLAAIPESFNFYSKRLETAIRSRREAMDTPEQPMVDWATAEELAFATILEEGIAIRLAGQDSERGTFSHRHAALYDAQTGLQYIPLQHLAQAKAAFEVRNSPLSEEAALGFEYGYNVQEPHRLVLWEAQYGDFLNGAQTIVDEFIVSAREKWGQTPSLVLLLPHGHEGRGPDHSSAHLERFLQLGAKTNIRVANCTSSAQYFHLLRRQALLLTTDPLPLVVMAPKSLLRNKAISSSINELVNGRWQPVIADMDVESAEVVRLVLCSGKFYLDLLSSDYKKRHPEVAVARVEQLYPFPHLDLSGLVAQYPNLREIIWAQEEPKNMGAWEFINWRLRRLVSNKLPVSFVGRRRSSSPAEGSSTAHEVNQAQIIEYAFEWKFETQ